MGSVVVSLLPYIVGSALVPIQIIIGLLLLQSPDRGLLKGSAYVAGMTLTRLLQGAAFGLFLGESVAASAEGGQKGPVVATLLLLLGIILLVTAYKKWRKQPDPDDPPPKWLAAMDSLTVLQALGIGLTLPLVAVKLWVFTLSALATIAATQMGWRAGVIAYLSFILLAQALLLAPLVLRLALPQQSKVWLVRAAAGLTAHNRPIVIGVSLVFGLLFLQSGLSGLRAI